MHEPFLDIAGTETGGLYRCSEHMVQRGSLRIVLMSDVHIFGGRLAARLRNMISTIPELEDVFFITQGVGQCGSLVEMERVLRRFNLDKAVEVVLHVAFDIEEDGSALFWRCKELEEAMNKKIAFEYCVMGYGSTANSYFVYDEDQAENVPSIRMCKFYSATLKDVRRITNSPFKRPIFGALFWKSMFRVKPLTVAMKKEFESAKRGLEIVKNNVNMLKRQTRVRCRTEFIVSTLTPDEETMKKTVEIARESYERHRCGQRNMLLRVPLAELAGRIEMYIDPVFHTLDLEVSKCWNILNDRGSENSYLLTVEKFHTLCACEAIIAYMCFGISVSTSQRRHDNNLCRSLGLISHISRRMNATDELFTERLSYYEDCTVRYWLKPNEINVRLFDSGGRKEGNILNLCYILNKLTNWDYEHVTSAAKAFAIYILEHGAARHTKFHFDRLKPCKSSTYITHRRVAKLVTSRDFIERLFKPPGRKNEFYSLHRPSFVSLMNPTHVPHALAVMDPMYSNLAAFKFLYSQTTEPNNNNNINNINHHHRRILAVN